MSPTSDGPARRVLRWLRAGRPDGVAPGDYVAVVAVLHKGLTEAEAEEVATALVDEGYYDDELISLDEIHEVIAARVPEQASQEDIERVSELLAKAGINLDADVPGADA